MTAAAAVGTSGLLAELHGLWDRLPVPQPSWHPYVAHIASSRTDFERALELAVEHPETLELVVALIDGETEAQFDEDAPLELRAAWKRLEALPLPSGQHPYLDDILPALDAHRLLLVALSHTIRA